MTSNLEILTPDEEQRQIIIEENHAVRVNLHRGIHGIIREYQCPIFNKDIKVMS